MVERTPRYTDPTSTQTLREALDEYYDSNASLLRAEDLPVATAEMFKCHDAGHVVFGCDTSIRGETLIDTWTIFGSTAGLRGYAAYFKYPEVNAIFADTGIQAIAAGFFRCLPDVVRVVARGLRLQRKWPWASYTRFLDTPLREIRHEFGIRVV